MYHAAQPKMPLKFMKKTSPGHMQPWAGCSRIFWLFPRSINGRKQNWGSHMSSARGIPTNQAFMIMMLTAGLTNHVMIIPVLLEKSGRDAWITILVSAVLFMPWVLLVLASSKSRQPFDQASVGREQRQSGSHACDGHVRLVFLRFRLLYVEGSHRLDEIDLHDPNPCHCHRIRTHDAVPYQH